MDQEKKLLDDFYRAGKMSASDYFKHIHDWLREMLDLYNSVISDITKLLDKEIDKLEKERDARIKQIEEERDAELAAIDETIKAQEEKIKKKQKEIDLLQKANEKRKQELDLQKAMYELERARNQRTLLRYEEGADGKGQLVYRPNEANIKSAQESLEEKEYEKRLKILEEELELLNEEKEKLDEQRQAIEDHYQTMLDETNKYYDEAIKSIEEYKSRWEELLEIEEQAQMRVRLESLGLSMDEILSLDEGSFEAFKEKYIGILADIYRENGRMTDALGQEVGDLTSYLGQMQPFFDSLNGLDLSSFENAMASLNPAMQTIRDLLAEVIPNTAESVKGVGEVTDAFNKTADAVKDVASAVNGSGGSSGSGSGTGTEGGSGGGEDLSSAISDLNSKAESELGDEGLKGKFAKVKDYITGELVPTINGDENSLKSAILEVCHDDYEIKIAVTPEDPYGLLRGLYKANGDNLPKAGAAAALEYNGTVGAAFFNGYPGLDSPEENAIRSEFGQPELTVYPNGTYEITTTPTISDLPKGTVIFNEEQTKRILKNSGKGGKAFASGTNYMPLQDAMPDKAEIFERFSANLQSNISKINSNISDMTSGVRDIAQNISNITTNGNVGGNTVNVGGINVTCPGVTEAEVARNLGGVLEDKLSGMFTGFALKANQRAMRR